MSGYTQQLASFMRPPAGGADTYRVPLVIDADQVDSNLSNFPVFVDLSDMPAGFWSHVTDGGGDIRVYKSDGTTEVAREVVSCDTGTETGELYFLAAGTDAISSSSDTTFYIAYGSGDSDYAEDATYGAEAVWATDYNLVLHFADAVSGGTAYDSTSNDLDFTIYGSPTEVAGVLGSAYSLNGAGDYLTVGVSSLLNPEDLSVELVVYVPTGNSQYDRVYEYGGYRSDPVCGHGMEYQNSSSVKVGIYSTGFKNVGNIPVGSQNYTVVTSDRDGPSNKLYENGSLDTQLNTETRSIAAAYDLAIGAQRDNPTLNQTIMTIDEFRIASTIRSADWVSAQYVNWSAPNTFYTVGSEQSV